MKQITFQKQDRQVITDTVQKTKTVSAIEKNYWSNSNDTISITPDGEFNFTVVYKEKVEYIIPEDFAIVNGKDVFFGYKLHDLSPLATNTAREDQDPAVSYSHPTGYDSSKFALTKDNAYSFFNRKGLTFVNFTSKFGPLKSFQDKLIQNIDTIKVNNEEADEEYYDIKW